MRAPAALSRQLSHERCMRGRDEQEVPVVETGRGAPGWETTREELWERVRRVGRGSGLESTGDPGNDPKLFGIGGGGEGETKRKREREREREKERESPRK